MEAEQHAIKKTNGSTMKSERKFKNTLKQMKMKTHHTKSTGCSKSNSQRDVQNKTGLHQKTRKISNNLTCHLKELGGGGEKQKKPKVNRRKHKTRQDLIKKQKKSKTTKTATKKNRGGGGRTNKT